MSSPSLHAAPSDAGAISPPSHRSERPPAMARRRRSESIDAFFATLSAWDLLYIRSRFRNGKISLGGFAGLAQLPPEVVSLIVPHLRLQDVLSSRLVCRSWREVWTGGVVATALCRSFFPGLLELHGHGGAVADRSALFLAAARRYLRRHFLCRSKLKFISWDVRWSSELFINPEPMMVLPHDLQNVDFGDSPLTVCYADGKIAWQPANGYAIVDDLRTRRRHRVTFAEDYLSGRPLQLQAVTENFVVLASSRPSLTSPHVMDNGRVIQMFHLDLMRWKRISLPGVLAKCYAHGHAAAFVTKLGHVVVVGSWGGKVIELETDHAELHRQTAGWEKELGGVPGVMFHPTNADLFYVVWLNSPALPDRRIHTAVVVRYENSTPVRRFESSLSHPRYRRHSGSGHPCPVMRFTLLCQKMNGHGLYSIGVAQYKLRGHGSRGESESRGVEWISLCFNVLTESFVQYRYKYREIMYASQEKYNLCAWGDQLMIMALFDGSYRHRNHRGLAWLHASYGRVEEFGSSSRTEIDYTLAYRYRINISGYLADIGSGRHVFADEDFLIITTGLGFLVCSWSDEVQLPGHATVYPNMPEWPRGGERMEPPQLPTLWDSRTVTNLQMIS